MTDATNARTAATETREFLYFTDPMCSWCYGFGPEIAALSRAHADTPLSVIQGGLRPDERRPMSAAVAQEILSHWEHVTEATGLPFARDFFANHPDFVYDTAPAARAVVVAGMLNPAAALAFQSNLQKLFYAEGQDPRDVETCVRAAENAGLDSEAFRTMFTLPEAEERTRAHFTFSRELGVASFPTLALRLGERHYLVARGYAPHAELEKRLQAVERAAVTAPAG